MSLSDEQKRSLQALIQNGVYPNLAEDDVSLGELATFTWKALAQETDDAKVAEAQLDEQLLEFKFIQSGKLLANVESERLALEQLQVHKLPESEAGKSNYNMAIREKLLKDEALVEAMGLDYPAMLDKDFDFSALLSLIKSDASNQLRSYREFISDMPDQKSEIKFGEQNLIDLFNYPVHIPVTDNAATRSKAVTAFRILWLLSSV